MTNPEDLYLKVAQASLESLDDFLQEDLDLISRYLVLRFLKTSPEVLNTNTPEDISQGLRDYLDSVYPFVVTFVMSANSSPFGESTA